MIADPDWIFRGRRYRVKDREKVLVFGAINANPRGSRKSIASGLKLRPTTVSRVVQELIDDGLVEETGHRGPARPGRPEHLLRMRPNRCLGIAVHVQSRELRGALVNLDEKILAESSVHVPADATSGRFLRACLRLIDTLRERAPEGAQVVTVALSLVGTVNARKRVWLSSARWPGIRNLGFSQLEERISIPVSLRRALDNELEYLLANGRGYGEQNVLLFHWGFGIGSACSCRGTILDSSVGRFGEIGHTRIGPESDAPCLCGARGCVETRAALWALLPEIRKSYPEVPDDEEAMGDLLSAGAADLPAVQRSVEVVGQAVVDLYKIFYPDRVLFVGPFTNNRQILERIAGAVRGARPRLRGHRVRIETVKDGFRGCVVGSVLPAFRESLRQLLVAKT